MKNYIGEKGDLKAEVEKANKSKKLWTIIGISAGAAFVGALIWALVK